MNWKVSCVRPLSRILSLIEICRNLFLTLVSGHEVQVFLKNITQQENIKQTMMITTARNSRNLFRSKKSSPRRLSRMSSSASFSYIGSSTPMINCSFLGVSSQYSIFSESIIFSEMLCELRLEVRRTGWQRKTGGAMKGKVDKLNSEERLAGLMSTYLIITS